MMEKLAIATGDNSDGITALNADLAVVNKTLGILIIAIRNTVDNVLRSLYLGGVIFLFTFQYRQYGIKVKVVTFDKLSCN